MTTQSARATQQQQLRDIIAAFANGIASDLLESAITRGVLLELADIRNPLAPQVLTAIHAERGWRVAEERIAS